MMMMIVRTITNKLFWILGVDFGEEKNSYMEIDTSLITYISVVSNL